MQKCPICNNECSTSICAECGFDFSRHREQRPAVLPESPEPVFHCPSCGGHAFTISPKEQTVRCLTCSCVVPLKTVLQTAPVEIAKVQTEQTSRYKFPPISLLERPMHSAPDGTLEMKRRASRLNELLTGFNIDAHIVDVTRGPGVTRYDVELGSGVRLNKLTAIAEDIALSLGVNSVRITAVPDRFSVIGIEVPNQSVTNVTLREVIDSEEFHRSSSASTFAVGRDISNRCIVGSITKMPHLLMAGTVGSGKSVCIHSIIISLLYQANPADVKLIMVDPTTVELDIYNEIPHLLTPVITDPWKAAGSLQWAVTEMMRRYKLMSDAGARDLEGFNLSLEAKKGCEKLPRLVIIIEELADLMLMAAKEVEDAICRIAQMGRAAGIHLIIGTNRPSADVITGLMKANIPSRIAFSVASAMESRIILDTMGAEKLMGKGDMLYAPIGIGKPQRIQSCFVSVEETQAVADYVKAHSVACYDKNVMDKIEQASIGIGQKRASAPEPEANADELLSAAMDIILETGSASVATLQRHLKIGYARSARIIDELEERGIIGPFLGARPRDVLITKEQWAARKNSDNESRKAAIQTCREHAAPEPKAEPTAPDSDELLPAAMDIILETGLASVSLLQRRLKLGYARAARIISELEEQGLIGPFHGTKPRAILVTREQWAARAGQVRAGETRSD